MRDKNLLASVALFGELYNSEKYTGIYAIIADFIKGAIAINKRYNLTSYEIKTLLKDTYDFNIIESVIRYVLTTTLKADVDCRRNVYYFKEETISQFASIQKDISEKNKIKDKIFSALIDFVNYKEKTTLLDDDINELFENFTHFLFDNGITEKYSNHISTFIVQNETNTDFLDELNLIREGIILYQGLKYTGEIEELGIWKDELTIYLNTEYLFNALGYNGLIFQEIFNDFIKLVNEINEKSFTNGKAKLINLKYLPETKEEVESFFISAESIKKGVSQLEPWRTAMKSITDACQSLSDVASLKAGFYLKLEKLGIEYQEFDFSFSDYSQYNVEDLSVLEELRKISKEKSKRFDEEACFYFFNIFTKINFFRKGSNDKPFEKVKHILMTESGFGKYLGHNNLVKFAHADASFAKDIDFITTRFWFSLKKGFSDKTNLPKSFDVLTKAKVVLSSHISNSLSHAYDKLVLDTKEGKISKEEALARSYALRVKPNKPEDISVRNIDSTFEFLNNEEYLEEVYREKIRKDDLLHQTQIENERLQAEIKRRDELEKQKKLADEKAEYDKQKNTFIESCLINEKNINIKAALNLLFVIILNFLLASFGVIVSISIDLKKWLSEFGVFQIVIIILYIIIIVAEVFGRSYLFNKERILKGWHFILFFFNSKKRKDFIEIKKQQYAQLFDEKNMKS